MAAKRKGRGSTTAASSRLIQRGNHEHRLRLPKYRNRTMFRKGPRAPRFLSAGLSAATVPASHLYQIFMRPGVRKHDGAFARPTAENELAYATRSSAPQQ